MNVARSLRYRTLQQMIGKTVAVTTQPRIVDDVSTFVADFAHGCTFTGPEQSCLDGQIAKYGLLDLRFKAPSTMLDSESAGGVPLLRELGFVTGDMQKSADDPGGSAGSCIEELGEDIAKNTTHLLLLLKSFNPDVTEMSITDRLARMKKPSIIEFPITFSVVDACVSNSLFVWMNKHFYL
ncbi:MAG: hypothetical protein R3C49_11360 [Planctomycetaceae bacterium]